MDPAAAKQQVVERIKQANNILVTVSTNPSVDQLAACIGLTLLLTKMEKHATAVFSGIVPSTIEFLQPEKTLETNTDSLRDFIISLDKNKADKLRYKVEDQVVKVFITPYRTSISQDDLTFSQGDFNVEVVLALGVKDRTQIDAAIAAHGRILHDATVVSLNVGQDKVGDIGQINWQDSSASSLSEMLVSISESFGTGLIDNQMANAFLTGIVAQTNRFSNAKTSPKVMTIAAQLMAAGANQQLIVSKLEPPQAPKASVTVNLPKAPAESKPSGPKPAPAQTLNGTLNVSHQPTKKDSAEVQVNPSEIHIDEQGNLSTSQTTPPPEADKVEDEPEQTPIAAAPVAPVEVVPPPKPVEAPIPGPHTFLDPKSYQQTLDAPFTASTQPEWQNPYDTTSLDPLSGQASTDHDLFKHNNPIKPPEDHKSSVDAPADLSQIRSAVENAIDTKPFDPAGHPIEALQAMALPNSNSNAQGGTEMSLPLPGVNITNSSQADNKPPGAAQPPLNPPPLTLPSVPPIPSNNLQN